MEAVELGGDNEECVTDESDDRDNDTGSREISRERGRGTCVGSSAAHGSSSSSSSSTSRITADVGPLTGDGAETFNFNLTFCVFRSLSFSFLSCSRAFFGVSGAMGREGGTAGVSDTFGRPEWGPLRLRIEEKCSQSW